MITKKKNILNSRILFKNIEPASKRIALILKQLSNKIENKKLQNIFKIKISLFFFEIYNQLKRSIYNVIFSYKNLNEYKFPNFSKKIIENKIQKLAINYKFKITFKITKLGNRFWLIEN